MIKYILDPTSDMHRDLAQELFLIKQINKKYPDHKQLRQAAKNGFVFPQFYGDYFKSCAIYLACEWGELPKSKWKHGQGIALPSLGQDVHLSDWLISNGIKSIDAFEEHVRHVEKAFWNKRFRVYAQWKDKVWEEYLERGYFDLFTGFRCSGVMSKNDVTNYPIQGAAFHCLLRSFIEIDRISREEKWDSKLIGQIHDSLLLDIHPSERDYVLKTVYRITCEELRKVWKWIIVPLNIEMGICDVDRPWNEKEEYKLAA